jgi:hypothetical protein
MKKFKLNNTYEMILKKHEFAFKKEKDLKPRNIFNPHMSIKAILGWINFNLIKLMKHMNKSFIHGMNTEDLGKYF